MRTSLVLLLAGTLLMGCQSAGTKFDYPISEEAKQALARAEADIKEAQVHQELWTTAQMALENAKKAAAKGDSEGVIKFTQEASDLAKIGIEQARYPSVQ